MYVLADIDQGGYIRVFGGQCKTVHRESRRIEVWVDVVHTRIDQAKKWFKEEYDNTMGITLLLHLDWEGGVDTIWIKPSDKEEVTRRLKTWAGCYGMWPVKELNV